MLGTLSWFSWGDMEWWDGNSVKLYGKDHGNWTQEKQWNPGLRENQNVSQVEQSSRTRQRTNKETFEVFPIASKRGAVRLTGDGRWLLAPSKVEEFSHEPCPKSWETMFRDYASIQEAEVRWRMEDWGFDSQWCSNSQNDVSGTAIGGYCVLVVPHFLGTLPVLWRNCCSLCLIVCYSLQRCLCQNIEAVNFGVRVALDYTHVGPKTQLV